MAFLNKVFLIGRLTANPDPPRVLPNSGATVVKFSFAVGKSKKNPQTGQWENDPNPLFIDCEAFTQADSKFRLTDLISQYLSKGKQALLEGRLQLDRWEDKNGGGMRSKIKLIVDGVQFLDGGQQNQGQSGYSQPQQTGQGGSGYSQPQDDFPPPNQPGDDNIPF